MEKIANIEKMAAAYNKFKEVDAFLRIIPLKEIKENDYNLNVTLYVFQRKRWKRSMLM